LELSADGPQTAGLVIQPFQTVARDVFIRAVAPKRGVKCALKIYFVPVYLFNDLLPFCGRLQDNRSFGLAKNILSNRREPRLEPHNSESGVTLERYAWQCDNDNRCWDRRCDNIVSYEFYLDT